MGGEGIVSRLLFAFNSAKYFLDKMALKTLNTVIFHIQFQFGFVLLRIAYIYYIELLQKSSSKYNSKNKLPFPLCKLCKKHKYVDKLCYICVPLVENPF